MLCVALLLNMGMMLYGRKRRAEWRLYTGGSRWLGHRLWGDGDRRVDDGTVIADDDDA